MVAVLDQFFFSLQPASWRGIPFSVQGTQVTSTARRTRIHEYPNREGPPWVEDLGLATQHLQFKGWLIGVDCATQRDKLKKALEIIGPGPLVHPSVGKVNASIQNYSFNETTLGRVIDVEMAFVIASNEPQYGTSPTSATSQSGILGAVTGANFASAVSFASKAVAAIKSGNFNSITSLLPISGPAGSFIKTALSSVQDARSIFGAVKGLGSVISPGNSLDRFAPQQFKPPSQLNVVDLTQPDRARVIQGGNILLSTALTKRTAVVTAATTAEMEARAL